MTRGLIPFTRKELSESVRTYKLLILALVTAAFGLLGPLIIKYMPLLFDALMKNETMTGGFDIRAMLPPPSAMAGWAEFISGVSQTGTIAAVIVFAGCLNGETGKNTLIPLLARGLSRHAVVIAKFINIFVSWTVSYVVSVGLTWAAIAILFPGETAAGVPGALFCLWLYVLFMSAVTLVASALCKNMIGTLLVTLGVWAVTLFISMFPMAARWNPMTLATSGITILAETETLGYYTPTLALTGGLTLVLMVLAMFIFRRRKI